MNMRRRDLLAGVALLGISGCASSAASTSDAATARDLTRLDRSLLVTPEEALEWHRYKDAMGPTISGSPSWHHFMEFVEAKLREAGCVDVRRNTFSYDYWHTTEWPDDSHWSLSVAGQPIRVANYGANSGMTGPDGTTAPLIYYDHDHPPADIAGKIVVFQPVVRTIDVPDYEYYSGAPDGRAPPPTAEETYQNNIRMNQQGPQLKTFVEQVATPGRAAGIIFVMDANYERLKGYYTFSVPALYNCPSVFLDRTAGAPVVAAARRGAQANLKLLAEIDQVETYQLMAVLPGRNYGTPQDEMIQLTTHSDGPSISQDDGAFGILGVLKYWARIPQAERPRSIFYFVDNRHYMPGAERAFAQYDWFQMHPEARQPIKAVIGMEHLGQREYFEHGEEYAPTGRADDVRIWVTNNQNMIDIAVKSVRDNAVPNAYVRDVDRPGVNGQSQGGWLGLAGFGRRIGIPAFAIMGDLDAYWTTTSRIDRFDPNLFCTEVAFAAQLVGALMTADFAQLQAPPIDPNARPAGE